MDAAEAQLKAAAVLRERMEEMMKEMTGEGLLDARTLRVYNPLTYAWNAFEEYVVRYGGTGKRTPGKRTLFLGMNPGPWGMAQTGVPFGEVSAVRDWLKISAPVGRPPNEHPNYPVDGYACKRSEVSGKRLWGLFAERFENAEAFFEDHFVANYCPLLFIEETPSENSQKKRGAHNLTPDKLPAPVRSALFAACDAHLRALVEALAPRCVVGVGLFAAARAGEVLSKMPGTAVTVGKMLHPSPASPKSNAGWAPAAARQLAEQGIWPAP
jgi:single-strand selective monofunctional uracil DNA glycosylase